MKILVIGYLHPKNDKRVFRTVKALSKEHYASYQYYTNNANEKFHAEGNISYIPTYYVKNIVAHPLIKFLKRKHFDSKILNIIKNEDFDILYFHHFLATKPLEPFKIAKKLGKVVVYDIHEYHPYNFLARLTGIKKKIKERIMFKIFRKQLEYSDKLIFVSPEVKEDIFQTLNIERDVLIVPNYAAKGISSSKKERKIIFVGGTIRKISKEKVILKQLINYGFKFEVIGLDKKDLTYLNDIPHSSIGFLPYDEMIERISKAAFSLISYKTTEEVNYKNDLFALPHKYYDSIASETPVIVNKRFVSMAKEVEKLGIGVVIDTNKPDEAVRKILKAYDNYETLIENIRKHKDKFIWNEEKEKTFVDFVCDG